MEKNDESIFSILKCYNTLGCNYWSSDNQISRSYHIKMKYNINIQNNMNEDELKKLKTDKEVLEKSFEILFNLKEKEKYLYFIFLNYTLSQPTTLEKLKSNFSCFVFPYYIFLLNISKSNNIGNYVILDFIKSTINFFKKDVLERSIDMSLIINVLKSSDNEIILKNNEDISFYIQIQQQRDLVYVLLSYMLRKSRENAEEKLKLNKIVENNLNITYSTDKNSQFNEILEIDINNLKLDDLRLLHDELYLPSGIILKSTVTKRSNKVISTKSDRFILLGNSNIFIFKDESMRSLRNIIPICHCNILFEFNEENLKMKIKIQSKKYILYFKSIDEFQIWRSTINDLADFKINEKIEDSIITNFLHHSNESSIEYKKQLNILNDKIDFYQENLKQLQRKKEIMIKEREQNKELIEKIQFERFNSEDFESIQDQYLNNRIKRMTYNNPQHLLQDHIDLVAKSSSFKIKK